jgi:ubiquinone/menaquinone biosynthesis C-methylase UbiE
MYDEGYTRSFGVEWSKHQLTQYDHYYGKRLSEERFFNETGWDKNLSQQIIIEAGCGSGRFTEWALSTGAVVLSFDLSNAVEVNQKNNGDHPNLFLVQGDLYHIPFKKGMADKLFCFGVLQHTPSPKRALYSLIPYVKKNGGEIVFDIYLKKFHTKYLIRPLLKTIPPEILYKLCKHWVNVMWPFASILRKISPQYGPRLNWQLMIADHSREGVPKEKLKEWSYLDTFDMLSPKYDRPATLKDVGGWLTHLKEEEKIRDFTIKLGYNGIEGRIFK